MTYAHATILVSAAQVDTFRKVSAQLGFDTDGMYLTEVRVKGSTLVSDYISNGMMPMTYLDAIQIPAKLKAEFDKKWDADVIKKSKKFTLAEVTISHAGMTQHTGKRDVLIEGVTVSVDEGPFELLDRMGKELVHEVTL